MSFSRRTFLIGAGSGLSLLALAACTDAPPVPTFSPTLAPPSPVPKPRSIVRSAWSTDPFARGAASFPAVGSTPQHRADLSESLLDRLFFAGEATSDAPGTVRGARTSGARAANEVAKVAEQGERIIIVGAGAAGAEAARLLSILGHRVGVIEARDRTGGRIDTLTSEDGESAELGAWRLAPEADADVLTALARLDVTTAELGTLVASSANREVVEVDPAPSIAAGISAVDAATAWATQQPADTSLEDSLAGAGVASSALLDDYLAGLATTTGADAAVLSSWFSPAPAEPESLLVTGGLSILVDAALDGIDTSLNTAVVSIAWDEDSVSLRLGTGESMKADRVILTVPLGVLKAGSIEFDPLLPFTHRTAISALGMGNIETVRLSFDEAFWSTEATYWTVTGMDAVISTWINLQPITGEPVLVGLVGGEAAAALVDLSDDELIALAQTSLEPFAES